jgi:hypothetical protein
MTLTAEQKAAKKAEDIRIAKAAYAKAELGRLLGTSSGPRNIGEQLTAAQIADTSTGSLFGYISSVLNSTASNKLQQQQDACAFLNQYVDTPYKNIITSLTGTVDVIPTEIVTQNIQAVQVELESLQETVEDRKKDQQTAIVRDKILRSGNGTVTNHQIYLLGRPLRPASIPFLWALSTLFIGFALLIFYTYYPYTTPPLDVILFDLYMFFTDPFTWAVLFSIASVVILFLSLRIAKIL